MRIAVLEIMQTWRGMLRRPGYLLLATVVLSLGIGATVAVAALIQALLLRPLPYAQPSRLVALGEERLGVAYRASPEDYQHMWPLAGLQSIGLISRYTTPKNIAGGGEPELVPTLQVDRGLLSTLGVRLTLGRNFNPDEDRPGGPRAAILAYGFWMRRYGGDPHVLGRLISIEGVPTPIVGVLPRRFGFPSADLVLPFALPPASTDDGVNDMAVGRLAPDAQIDAIGAQLNTRLHALQIDKGGPFIDWTSHRRFRADPLQAALRVSARPVLLMFLASALGLLAIAWINLSNLMLARVLAQRQDAAVRMALGAPRSRIVSPVAAEGLLIGAAAALAGTLLAVGALTSMRRWIPAEWSAGTELQPSPWLIGVALLLGLASVLVAVALGLWQASRSVRSDDLRSGGRHGLSRRGGQLGRALVVAQVGLATLLLCASGAFLKVLYDAARSPLGFQTAGVLTFELAPIRARYPDAAAIHQLTRQLLERFAAIPGVQQGSVGTALPAGSDAQNFYLGNIRAHGQRPLRDSPQYRAVDDGFFGVFGIRALRGRVPGPADGAGSEPVAVINAQLDRVMFDGHGLGQWLDYTAPTPGGGGLPVSARIVGVIPTVSPFGPLGDRDGMVYVPWSQVPATLLDIYRDGNPLHFALRVRGTPDDYRAAVQSALAALAPDQPIARVASMEAVVHATTDAMRLNLLLVGVFSVLALLLAAAGVYAVMALSVRARAREFALRLALGCTPARLTATVFGSGLRQIGLGLAAGLGLAVASMLMLRASLTQITPSLLQPLVWLAVCVVLACAGALASAVPALRAGRTEPMRSLGGE